MPSSTTDSSTTPVELSSSLIVEYLDRTERLSRLSLHISSLTQHGSSSSFLVRNLEDEFVFNLQGKNHVQCTLFAQVVLEVSNTE